MKQSQKKKTNVARHFPIWIGAVAIIVVALVVVLLLQQKPQEQSRSLPAEISIAQASEKRDQGAFLLDVRQPEEWVQGHIPGSTLIPLGELPNRLNEIPQDQEIVVVCRSGNRSAQGRDILLSAGFEQVTSMAGGVTQWQQKGYPTVTGP